MNEIVCYHEIIDDSRILNGKTVKQKLLKILQLLCSPLLVPGLFLLMAADFFILIIRYLFMKKPLSLFSKRR